MSQPPDTAPKLRILFVCAGNTCRSVLAEYIARKKFGRWVEPASAGLRPGTIDDAANAIDTLKDLMSVDASNHIPTDVREANLEQADLIVAMTKQIASQVKLLFPNFAQDRLVCWQIQDPYGDNLAQYRSCAQRIYKQLQTLPQLAARRETPSRDA